MSLPQRRRILLVSISLIASLPAAVFAGSIPYEFDKKTGRVKQLNLPPRQGFSRAVVRYTYDSENNLVTKSFENFKISPDETLEASNLVTQDQFVNNVYREVLGGALRLTSTEKLIDKMLENSKTIRELVDVQSEIRSAAKQLSGEPLKDLLSFAVTRQMWVFFNEALIQPNSKVDLEQTYFSKVHVKLHELPPADRYRELQSILLQDLIAILRSSGENVWRSTLSDFGKDPGISDENYECLDSLISKIEECSPLVGESLRREFSPGFFIEPKAPQTAEDWVKFEKKTRIDLKRKRFHVQTMNPFLSSNVIVLPLFSSPSFDKTQNMLPSDPLALEAFFGDPKLDISEFENTTISWPQYELLHEYARTFSGGDLSGYEDLVLQIFIGHYLLSGKKVSPFQKIVGGFLKESASESVTEPLERAANYFALDASAPCVRQINPPINQYEKH